jgi:phenylalanyl-tRNA synthetase beta chain
MAPVYLRGDSPKKDDEVLLASGVVTGAYAEAKGCVEAVFEAMGLAARATFALGAPAPLRRDRSATVRVGDEAVGWIGELGARSLAKFGLEAVTSVFELRADRLAALADIETKYRPVPRFPVVERDLAWVVDESVTWAAIEAAARGAAGEMLASIRPFDVFRGSKLGAGKKSVALRLELRAADRTLTTAEADACIARVLAELTRTTRGALRS